jgi:hypothetical protein
MICAEDALATASQPIVMPQFIFQPHPFSTNETGIVCGCLLYRTLTIMAKINWNVCLPVDCNKGTILHTQALHFLRTGRREPHVPNRPSQTHCSRKLWSICWIQEPDRIVYCRSRTKPFVSSYPRDENKDEPSVLF